jgi:hypothetical protein
MKYDYVILDSKTDDDDKFSFALTVKDNPRYAGKILAFKDFKMDEDEKGDLFINTQMLIVDGEDKSEIAIEPEDQVYMEGLMQYMVSDLLEKLVERESAKT